MRSEQRRETLAGLLVSALAAVDPETLTRDALLARGVTRGTVIAIGKAAPAMCRGTAAALGTEIEGLCVATRDNGVPPGFTRLVGDHPLPGDRSFAAGRIALDAATRAEERIIALISGGGSALCEHPRDGVSEKFIRTTNQRLLDSGAPIESTNLVRRHLSAIKNGGLAGAAAVPIDTFVLSDVCGGDPSLVASGPTLQRPLAPDAAIATMADYGIEVSAEINGAIRSPVPPIGQESLTVIGDGHTATAALVRAAREQGLHADEMPGWLEASVETALDTFLGSAGEGLTVATGEPVVQVTGDGVGGRNTHAALLAAQRLEGSDTMFAAFASDGVDGNSTSAGAIVDGTTVTRGGDPTPYLDRSDSATFLSSTGDLIETGPTGTNVSDIWVVWR